MRNSGMICLICVVTAACGGRQAPTRPTAEAPPAFRLPAGARPTAYRLDLSVTPGAERFHGTVEIDVELAGPTRTLWLQADKLDVRAATIDGRPAAARVAPPTWLALEPAGPMGPGAVHVKIDYEGGINGTSGTGIFQGRLEDRWYVYTQLEPSWARQAFPCFDEPGFKVPWQVTLRVPRALVAESNTPVESESPGEGDTKVVRFHRTRPMPSYLVAFAVGPFDVVDGGVAGRMKTPLRYLVPQGQAGKTGYMKKIMPRIVEELERYLDHPFPYEKLDVVAAVTPTWFHGAMENTGFIVSGVEHIVPGNAETLSFRRGALNLLAHETAHQWFGDWVTPAWWDDVWLSESFAEWLGERTLAQIEPSFWREIQDIDGHAYAINSDLEATASAIHREITSDYGIIDAFDGISYAKGRAVLAMLEEWLGHETLRRGIHDHLKAHADGSARAADFFAAVGGAAGRDLSPVLRSFIEQAGVPLVRGELRCQGGAATLHLTQTRLRPPGSADKPQLWSVPVCVRHGRNGDAARRECFLLPTGEADEPLSGGCPDWVVLNAGHSGYYVDASAAEALAHRDRLSRAELLGAISDLIVLANAGALPLADALRATEPLLATADADVRKEIAWIDREALVYVPDDDLAAMQRAIVARHGAVARALGAALRPGDDAGTTDLRRQLGSLVGGNAGDPKLAAEATALTRRWFADRGALDWQSLYWVPETAARTGDAKLLADLQAAARGASISEAETLVGMVPWFRDPALLREGFRWALSDDVPPAASYVVAYAPRGPERLLVHKLIEENADRLIARTPPDIQVRLIELLGQTICDAPGRAAFVRIFGERVAKMKDGAGAYRERLAEIDQCIALRRIHEPGLHGWLAGRER